MKIIDRDKTVDKILGSSFPANLLSALSYMYHSLQIVEDFSDANPDKEVDADLFKEMLQSTVATVSAFREAWAVYAEEEEEKEGIKLEKKPKKKEKKPKNETVQNKTD